MTVPGGHNPWQLMSSYRRHLTVFLLTVTASAVVGVATPVLAGRVVNVITREGSAGTVVRIA
ncbi:MAG TPA: hypothetical protein VE547_06240, partial [Mycobacteriales bacterium]|nr:hypothetical protein [Mycobacteriales bacterium]